MPDVSIERSFNYRDRHVPAVALRELYTTPTSGEVLFSSHGIPLPPVDDSGLWRQYAKRCKAQSVIPGFRIDAAYNGRLDGVYPLQMTVNWKTFRSGQEKGLMAELKKMFPDKSIHEVFHTMQLHLLGIDLLGAPEDMAARLAHLRGPLLDHYALRGLSPVHMNFNFSGSFDHLPRPLKEVRVSVSNYSRGGEVRLWAQGRSTYLDEMPVMAWYKDLERKHAVSWTSSISAAA